MMNLEKLNESLARIRDERAALAAEREEREASAQKALAAARTAQVAAIITPTKEAEAAAQRAAAEAAEAFDGGTLGIERERLLATAEAEVEAQIAAATRSTEAARVEAMRTALHARIAKTAPAFCDFITDVVAEAGLGKWWVLPEQLESVIYRAAGATPQQLLNAGKDRAVAIRAGKEKV